MACTCFIQTIQSIAVRVRRYRRSSIRDLQRNIRHSPSNQGLKCLSRTVFVTGGRCSSRIRLSVLSRSIYTCANMYITCFGKELGLNSSGGPDPPIPRGDAIVHISVQIAYLHNRFRSSRNIDPLSRSFDRYMNRHVRRIP